eukprot:4008525-Pleurochrysis_carterae.AAC.2
MYELVRVPVHGRARADVDYVEVRACERVLHVLKCVLAACERVSSCACFYVHARVRMRARCRCLGIGARESMAWADSRAGLQRMREHATDGSMRLCVCGGMLHADSRVAQHGKAGC